jgi:hypothetical protein
MKLCGHINRWAQPRLTNDGETAVRELSKMQKQKHRAKGGYPHGVSLEFRTDRDLLARVAWL